MFTDFNTWLKQRASKYEIRIIKGHCRKPELNLSQLRGHGKQVRGEKKYFSNKVKTFNQWLQQRGFTKYEIELINKNCKKLNIIVYDVDWNRVKNLSECIKGLIESFFESQFKEPLNKYYFYGCAAYNESEAVGHFHYGFQDYEEFEQRYNDEILTRLFNGLYDVTTFQFFVVLYEEKRIISLSEIERL